MIVVVRMRNKILLFIRFEINLNEKLYIHATHHTPHATHHRELTRQQIITYLSFFKLSKNTTQIKKIEILFHINKKDTLQNKTTQISKCRLPKQPHHHQR